MAARTISELANWDGHLDRQRQNSKWRRRSPSSLARDPNQPPQHATKFSNQKRAAQSNLERGDAFSNTPANTRLSGRVDTSSSSSSHLHTTPVHNSRPPPSRARIAQLSASTIQSEVIDLTMEDTEDELSVCDMLVPPNSHFNHRRADSRPRALSLSSGLSSPISFGQSLFTPPPPSRKRARLLLDHVAVPSFPRGLTKADYHPISDRHVVPPSSPLNVPSSPITERPLSSMGKERERGVVSPRNRHRRPLLPTEAKFLDACTMIPIHDDDTYPPLTSLDLATNTRFRFAQAWRQHASRLQEAELDWTAKFKLLGKAYIWAQSVNTPSPRMPGTTGYVSSEQLRSWELASSEPLPKEEELAHTTLVGGAHDLPPPNIPSGTSSIRVPAPSALPSTAVDMEHDMNQYFNGLSDSPTKHVPSRPHLASAHAFRSHLLHSADALGLGFPSLDDLGLARTGDHGCFLGVPPSPQPADMEPTPRPVPESPFKPVDYPPVLSSPVFESAPADTWAFEQGEGLLLTNDSPPSNDVVPPPVLGTIDPSLLGPGQSSQPPKVATQKKHSKLPEPVIYVRRPIDSSSLPVMSGKRPVQIKYRDSGGSPAAPVAQTGKTDEAPSNPVDSPVALSTSDKEDSPRPRKRLTSGKQRERVASDPDSDYVPTFKIKIKRKRASAKDVKPLTDLEDADADVDAGPAPTMSFCHQCRNTTVRPKMTCSNAVQGRVCGKRFCNRCILYRYPDVTFDERSAGFLCPVCTNTCNCSTCSRNRGEEFISMRLGGLAASLFKAKVTLVRDAGSQDAVPSTTTTPTPEPGTFPEVPQQPKFWAHVYGMEGERVGRAFMSREHMAHLRSGAGRALPPLPPPPVKKARKRRVDKERERDVRKGPRVFIGRPLASWRIREVRDLEPSVDVDVDAISKGKGKGKEKDDGSALATGRARCYIGDPKALYEPYVRMPGRTTSPPRPRSACSTHYSTPLCYDSDGSLTPLSELEGEVGGEGDQYWPQPEVGECCAWAPPSMSMPPSISVGLGVVDAGEDGSGGTSADVDGGQVVSPVSGLGSGTTLMLDAAMDVAVGNQPGSVSSTTVLPEADVARAINAALAALCVDPLPCP